MHGREGSTADGLIKLKSSSPCHGSKSLPYAGITNHYGHLRKTVHPFKTVSRGLRARPTRLSRSDRTTGVLILAAAHTAGTFFRRYLHFEDTLFPRERPTRPDKPRGSITITLYRSSSGRSQREPPSRMHEENINPVTPCSSDQADATRR